MFKNKKIYYLLIVLIFFLSFILVNKTDASSFISDIPTTTLNFKIYLHGIGNTGDNINPYQFNYSNKTPLHAMREIKIKFYDNNHTLLETMTANVTFNSSEGNFKGSVYKIDFLSTTSSMRILMDQYLESSEINTNTLIIGEVNYIPDITLTTGDTNNDKILSIKDYNDLINCYSDMSKPRSCSGKLNVMNDINDDGRVNQTDYNLFLREFTYKNNL